MWTSVRNRNLERLRKYLNKKQGRDKTAYASRDTVNQAMKGLDSLALKLTGQASKEIGKIAEARIRQVINNSG